MPSQIIQSYLNDTSVSKESRSKVLADLKSGSVNEQTLEKALAKKYTGKYGSPASSGLPQPKPQSEMVGGETSDSEEVIGGGGESYGEEDIPAPDAAEEGKPIQKPSKANSVVGGNLAKGLTGLFNPANFGKNIQNAVTGAAKFAPDAAKAINKAIPTTPQMRLKAYADNKKQYRNPFALEVIGGAVQEVPEAIGNTAKFATDVGKFLAPGGGIMIGGSEEEQKKARQMMDPLNIQGGLDAVGTGAKNLGSQGKEFVKGKSKDIGLDPDSIGAKIGEFGTDMFGAGKLLKLFGGAQKAAEGSNLLQKGGNLLANSAKGSTAATAVMEGRAPNAQEGALGLGVDTLFAGGGKLFKKLFKGKTPEAVQKLTTELQKTGDDVNLTNLPEPEVKELNTVLKNAEKYGIEQADINYISKLKPEAQEKALNLLEAAQKRLSDRNAPNVFDVAGSEVEDFIKKAKDLQSKYGQKVGEAKENLGKLTVNPQQVKNDTQDLLKKLNVKIKDKGVLDFNFSDIADNGAAKDKLTQIFEFSKKKDVNARDLEALTKQIDEVTGLLGPSGFKNTAGNQALKKTKGSINEAVYGASDEFKKANVDFSKLIKSIQRVENASKVPVGNGQIEYSGGNLLRRLLGNNPKKYQKAVGSIEELKTNFGVPGADDLLTSANLADIAEKSTGAVNPQSLSGQISSIPGMLAKKTPILGKLIEGAEVLKDFVQSQKAPVKKNELMTNLVKILPQATKKATGPGWISKAVKQGGKTADSVANLVNLGLKSLLFGR